VPWGYLTGVLVALAAVVVAVRPPPTNGPRARTPAFLLGTASSEVPMVFLLLLFGSTVLAVVSGDLVPPAGLVIAGLAALAAAGFVPPAAGELDLRRYGARPLVGGQAVEFGHHQGTRLQKQAPTT
jgi:hypothetical protein